MSTTLLDTPPASETRFDERPVEEARTTRPLFGRLTRPEGYDPGRSSVASAAGNRTSSTGVPELPSIITEHEGESARRDRFRVLNKWTGVVLAVDAQNGEFEARLRDATELRPDEVAKFALDEVSTSDFPLVEPGAIFYWSIGYLTTASGERRRQSVVLFRRRPVTTRAQMARRQSRERFFASLLGQ